MRSEKETKYREAMIAHLEHIKEKVDSNNEHLEKLNGRVRSTEISLSWIKGIGVTFAFVISTLLTYFHKYK